MIICKNCGEPVEKKFCPSCGQKASVKRIEMKWLLHQLPHAVWHIEKGFFYNVKQLFIRPGHAIHDFLIGKRKPFFNPLSYLAILILVNSLIMYYLEIHRYGIQEDGDMTKEGPHFSAYDLFQ
jgi:uncharacterized protein DUF3667